MEELVEEIARREGKLHFGVFTDEEIATADVMQLRDMSADTAEMSKQRITQHALFVQVDGTSELMRYLQLHIALSPTAYAPSGVAARILIWAQEQQHNVDITMTSTEVPFMHRKVGPLDPSFCSSHRLSLRSWWRRR